MDLSQRFFILLVLQVVSSYLSSCFLGIYFGTQLKYMAIEINTTMNVFNMGYEEGLPVYDQYEYLINNIVSRQPIVSLFKLYLKLKPIICLARIQTLFRITH